jgi:phospholipase C
MTTRRLDLRSQPFSRRVALRAAGAGAFAGLAGVTGLAATHQATPAPAAATPIPTAATPAPAEVPFDHIIVIFSENRTFDNLYGLFAGADGIVHPGAAVPQADLDGRVYATLPQVSNPYPGPPVADDRFPADLPNAPFLLDQFAPISEEVPSPQHRFYQHQLQLNGGRMDRYVAWSETGGLPMGFHDTTRLPLYPYAREYTLADAFFTGAFGGSMLNHFWLIAAATPVWPDAPADIVAKPEFAADGTLAGLPQDGDVTPDGFVINNVQPWYHPYQADTPDSHRMPPQTGATIGDLLSDAGRTWAWYAGGWNDALAGNPAATFEFHHQPFVYYEHYADGTEAKAEHLRDEEDFLAAVDDGTLPDVSFVKPLGIYDEHAGYSTVAASERHVVDLIEQVKASPAWERTAIIVTYDDFGGWYDHVMPPTVDRWGPGGRVPTLIVSPHAKKGFIDNTPYDHTSILKLIEWRFNLPPLTARDAAATNMLAAFDLGG